ncbi:hypothetical protein SUGI_0901960 [Cryptomeria japonica]|nr:hypothetical protein SUGI_0901960 [Cryptomeria japonica]
MMETLNTNNKNQDDREKNRNNGNNGNNGKNGNHGEGSNTTVLINNSKTASRTTPRPLMPEFLETPPRDKWGNKKVVKDKQII